MVHSVAVTWVGIATRLSAHGCMEAVANYAPYHTALDSANADFFLNGIIPRTKITAAIIISVFLVPYCASVYRALDTFPKRA